MEAFKPDIEFFKPYYEGRKRHKNYTNAMDVAFHIQFHFDGYFQRPNETTQSSNNYLPENVNPYFMRLIDQRRPTESADILSYRRLQYLPVTKVPCQKVVSSLKKIVKCADWKVDWSNSQNEAIIKDTENTLEHYCTVVFPKFDSIENWAYQNLIRWILIDPNGLICVMPLSWEVDSSEFLKPFPHIIQSKDVYDYKEDQYVVFLSPYVNEYSVGNGETRSGKIIMCVTKESYFEFKQTGEGTNDFELVEHAHNIGDIPAWLLGGETKTPDIQQPFFESFIGAMLPALDAAARDASDLDAEKVQHLFSTRWIYQTQNCPSCQGLGNVLKQGAQIVCPDCEGRGTAPKSPYRDVEINANNIDLTGKQIPTPPAGYITKPTEMVGLMRNEIKIEMRDALAAINMEFLADEPLNESGKAKEVDRDELNNFVYSIAYHLVENNIVPVFYFVNELRYSTLITSKEARGKMLPHIPVPQNYDFLTSKDAEDNLAKIAAAPISSGIKDAAEMSYIHAKFADEPEIRNKLILIHDHDPLPGYTNEQIVALEQAGLILKLDAALSIYIDSFASELLSDNMDFMDLSFEEQKTKLYEMAQKKLDALNTQTEENIMRMANTLGNKVDAEGNKLDNEGNIIEDRLGNKVTPKQRKKDRNPLNAA